MDTGRMIKTSEVHKYATYGLASSLASMMPLYYMTVFITDNLLISAALMGIVLTIARVIDFFFALITGGIIEKSKLKRGKYNSWIIIFKWVELAGMILMFIDTSALPVALRLVILFIAYILVNCSMDILLTSAYGVMSVMAGPDMGLRNKLSIRMVNYQTAGMIIGYAVTVPLVGVFTTMIGNQTTAYTIMSIIYGVLWIIGCMLVSSAAKPYDKTENAMPGAPVVTINDMVKSVSTNGQLLLVMVVYSLNYIGLFGVSGIGAYYFIYVLGNYNLMAVAMTITTAFGLIASIGGPKVGIKLGKKKAMVCGLIVQALCATFIGFIGAQGVVIYVLLSCVVSFGMYFYAAFGVTYMLDCGEYGLWKTGKDNRAVAMSMMSIPIKIGLAVGGALAAFGLSAIGYKPGMEPTKEFVSNFMLLLGVLPAVCYLIGAVLMGIGYRITDTEAAKYAKENAERMASGSGTAQA